MTEQEMRDEAEPETGDFSDELTDEALDRDKGPAAVSGCTTPLSRTRAPRLDD